MSYSHGDILLIKFPFTDLSQAKKRPVLVIKSSNIQGDFICLQITSKSTSSNSIRIEDSHINNGKLKLVSYLKYDKCFTLNIDIVDKKLADIHPYFTTEIQKLFCDATFR